MQSADDVRCIDAELCALEASLQLNHRLCMIPWIETARGVMSAMEICSASPRIAAVAFGAVLFWTLGAFALGVGLSGALSDAFAAGFAAGLLAVLRASLTAAPFGAGLTPALVFLVAMGLAAGLDFLTMIPQARAMAGRTLSRSMDDGRFERREPVIIPKTRGFR